MLRDCDYFMTFKPIARGTCFLFFTCLFTLANGQTLQMKPDSLYEVDAGKNQYFAGRFTGNTGSFLYFTLIDGTQKQVPENEIRRIAPVSKNRIHNGRFWPENLFAHRSVFAPSGYGLKANEFQYQNIILGINQFGYGITDNFSLSVGTIPIPFETALWLSGKLSLPLVKDLLAISGGFIAVRDLQFPNRSMNFYNGCLTFGNREHFVTIGFIQPTQTKKGLIYNGSLQLSGLFRISRKSHFLFEAHQFKEKPVLTPYTMAGFRTGYRKVKFEYGLFYFNDQKVLGPWLGLGISIPGKKRHTLVLPD